MDVVERERRTPEWEFCKGESQPQPSPLIMASKIRVYYSLIHAITSFNRWNHIAVEILPCTDTNLSALNSNF